MKRKTNREGIIGPHGGKQLRFVEEGKTYDLCKEQKHRQKGEVTFIYWGESQWSQIKKTGK